MKDYVCRRCFTEINFMIMNTHESYVSLETAKLLKKVGFDWVTKVAMDMKGQRFSFDGYGRNWNTSTETHCLSAPTLAVAQRWLREVKNMHVEIIVGDHNQDWSYYYFTNIHNPNDMPIINGVPKMSKLFEGFDTYEAALEAAINKCLTLLLEN